MNRMVRTMEIIEQIEKAAPKMSKGHRAIANFIIDNYDKAAYMTAAKLGEVTNVSESTVVRFTTELGYAGYPEFQSSDWIILRNSAMTMTQSERL